MMVNRTITLVLFVFAMTGVIAQSFNLEDVDVQLSKIHDDDQQIRAKWSDAFQKKLPTQQIILEMHAIDSINQQYVSKLLDEYGWPDNLSEKANKAFFYVIDHADNSFSEKYFPLLKEKGEQGILEMALVATLEDRILMRTSKKQKYGTQTMGLLLSYTNSSGDIIEEKNIFYVWPIEDNEKVDELRNAVGLPPLEQHLQESEDRTNIKVIWDKKMTIDDMKEKYPWLNSK